MPQLAAVPNPKLPWLQQSGTASQAWAGRWLLGADGRTIVGVRSVFHRSNHSFILFHQRDPVHLRPWDKIIFVPAFNPIVSLQPS